MLPEFIQEYIINRGITTLRPAQDKAVKAGLLDGKSVLVCTPTASGKTLVAEMAMMQMHKLGKKSVYVVPLKALATEKYREFTNNHSFKTGLSIGDRDSADKHLSDCDVIIVTAEKLDSLLRHHAPWLNKVGLIAIDEIHFMNDPHRGPTLEMLITMLRSLINPQILGLSATIGNPKELAKWLEAELVEDDWRPVRLDKGVYIDGKIEFPQE